MLFTGLFPVASQIALLHNPGQQTHSGTLHSGLGTPIGQFSGAYSLLRFFFSNDPTCVKLILKKCVHSYT